MSKKVLALRITAISLAVIIIGGLSAFFFVKPFRYSIENALMRPSKLYAKAEKKYVSENSKTLGAMYEKLSNTITGKSEIGYNTSTKVEFGEDFIKEANIEGLKSVTLKTNNGFKGTLSGQNYSLLYNDKNVISVNTVIDLDKKTAFVKVPELSSAYLSVAEKDLNTLLESSGLSMSNLTKSNSTSMLPIGDADINAKDLALSDEEVEKAIKRYTDIFIDSSKSVQKDTVKDSIDGVDYKYIALENEIKYEDLFSIGEDVLNELKEDDTIKNMVMKSEGITEEQYEKGIDQLIKSINSGNKDGAFGKDVDLSDTFCTITTYINNSREVMGREIEINDSKTESSFGYITVDNDKNYALSVWAKDGDKEIFSVEGSAKKKGEALTGTFNCMVLDGKDKSECTVSLEDAEIVDKENMLVSGKLTYEKENKGKKTELVMDCSVKNKKQTIKITVNQDKKSLGSIETSYEKTEVSDIKLPGSDAKVYDVNTQMEDYLGTIDAEGFRKTLTDALGEDLVKQLTSAATNIKKPGTADPSIDDYDDDDDDIEEPSKSESKYDFKNLKVVMNGKATTFPCPASLVKDKIMWEKASVEADNITFGQLIGADGKQDYAVSLRGRNNTKAPASMDKGVVERISMYSSAEGRFDFSINGIKNGSTIADINAAFGIKATDSSTIKIVDTKSTENIITFYMSSGKVSSLSLDMWKY